MRRKKAEERAERPDESVTPTATALAGEARRTGVVPLRGHVRDEEIPGEDEKMRAGDPDVQTIDNEYVGASGPGGHASTPDQSGIDDVGRMMGVQEEDSGALRTSSEILDQRDRRRPDLMPPARPPRAYKPEP